jgi:hypothetical protein
VLPVLTNLVDLHGFKDTKKAKDGATSRATKMMTGMAAPAAAEIMKIIDRIKKAPVQSAATKVNCKIG